MGRARLALFVLILAAAQAGGAARAGAWYTSSECGSRSYERRFFLRSDGIYLAEDQVAPCLKGMVCTWFGVVTWTGRYRVEADRIDMTVDRGPDLLGPRSRRPVIEHMLPEQDPAPQLVPNWAVPRSLKRDPDTGILSEQAPDGAECAFRRLGPNPLGR
jgi:hypothetical protein